MLNSKRNLYEIRLKECARKTSKKLKKLKQSRKVSTSKRNLRLALEWKSKTKKINQQ